MSEIETADHGHVASDGRWIVHRQVSQHLQTATSVSEVASTQARRHLWHVRCRSCRRCGTAPRAAVALASLADRRRRSRTVTKPQSYSVFLLSTFRFCLVYRDKAVRSPGELGVSKSLECDIFPSVLWRCWLVDRKGIRPVKAGC